MGGVLPEQPDPTRFSRVLDVGCGTGSWLIELARVVPTCSSLVGVDVSRPFVEDARAQAEAAHVSDRVEFQVMDALRMLEFPRNSFDLVNHRFGQGWLRTWERRKLLEEYQRVIRPGGVIRLTETDAWESSSPALHALTELAVAAAFQAGHLFALRRDGMTAELVRLLKRSGLEQVQMRASCLQFRAGTPEWRSFFEDIRLLYRTGVPFLRKWTRVPEDYEQIYQQMLAEMQQPEFVATMGVLTAWGTRAAV
jgi:ubiquinone/menaquinone biosynthesis C-methylase UbiE